MDGALRVRFLEVCTCQRRAWYTGALRVGGTRAAAGEISVARPSPRRRCMIEAGSRKVGAPEPRQAKAAVGGIQGVNAGLVMVCQDGWIFSAGMRRYQRPRAAPRYAATATPGHRLDDAGVDRPTQGRWVWSKAESPCGPFQIPPQRRLRLLNRVAFLPLRDLERGHRAFEARWLADADPVGGVEVVVEEELA
jgi:hypothetical protein